MRCKHEWELLLPAASKVVVVDKIGYALEVMLSGILMQRSVICSKCGRSGHKINSNLGGVRLHPSNYFVDSANEILRSYGLPEHEIITL
jgi:hypothetical protein